MIGIRPGTIGHVTSEAEDQWAYLDARIEEMMARDRRWMDSGGLEEMARHFGERYE